MEIVAIAPNMTSIAGHDFIYHECFSEVVKKLSLSYKPYIAKAAPEILPKEWNRFFSKKNERFKRFLEFKALFKEKKRQIFFFESFDGIDLIAYCGASFLFSKRTHYHFLLFRNDFKDNKWKEKCFLLALRFMKRCTFFSDSKPVANYFKGHLLPIPHTHIVKEKKTDEKIIYWWPGAPREEKGIKEIDFLLKLDKAKIWLTEERGGTLKKHLTKNEYLECLEKCDIVLLPYDPVSYRVRTSGIFVEAVVAGKIPIVKKGSWLARELEAFDLPELIVDWDNPNFFSEIEKVLKDKNVQKKFKIMRDAYRNFHSVDGLTKALASIISKLV